MKDPVLNNHSDPFIHKSLVYDTDYLFPQKSLEARSAGMQQSLVCGVTKRKKGSLLKQGK
jgi:hypothetical protein